MESPESGRFEKEMALLTKLTEQIKDQALPLEKLAPLVEQALAQASVCDRLLLEEEAKVAASIKGYDEMMRRLRVPRYVL